MTQRSPLLLPSTNVGMNIYMAFYDFQRVLKHMASSVLNVVQWVELQIRTLTSLYLILNSAPDFSPIPEIHLYLSMFPLRT